MDSSQLLKDWRFCHIVNQSPIFKRIEFYIILHFVHILYILNMGLVRNKAKVFSHGFCSKISSISFKVLDVHVHLPVWRYSETSEVVSRG